MSGNKLNGFISGKFTPFHNGSEQLITKALDECGGDVYVLVYDYPDLAEIPTAEMVEMMRLIINNERCKIIPCYNHPESGTTPEIRQAHNDYISGKLPADVKIDKVFCNEWWGQDVATYLDAELVLVDPERKNFPISAKLLREKPEEYLDYLNPIIAQRLNAIQSAKKEKPTLFSRTIDSGFLTREISDAEKAEIKSRAVANNPGYEERKLNSVMRWDVREFAKPHLPAILGKLKNPEAYSRQNGLRVLDMALRMPGQNWAIPTEFEQFAEAIQMAVEHERSINPDFDEKYFVYITIDQKKVLPGKSQRRAGYHSDAYVTHETTINNDETAPADNTYVMADALPTLFQTGPFPLDGLDPEDCESVLKYFDAASVGKEPITFPSHVLLKMTPYDIHTPDVNRTDETITRTFIKVQFSQEKYNLIGNTVNPCLSYENWTWIPRDPKVRNHRNSIIGWDRDDKAKFTEIYPYSIDFSLDKPDVAWAEPKFVYARKTERVRMEPATAGEMLYTEYEGDRITVNIAQQGDVKITTSKGDQYFLNEAKVKKRYKPEPLEDGTYVPMGAPQKMLIVTQPVMLRAPWGAMQYVPEGSALTTLGFGDMYLIHERNFKASYQVFEPEVDGPDACVTHIEASSLCAFCGKCDKAAGKQ